MRAYEFYEKRVFPLFLDLIMKGMEDLRPGVLAGARGDVLEIGFGTGLNLPHYPEAVSSLAALDPMDDMPRSVRQRIDRRIEAAPFPVECHPLPADGGLPFESGRFDTVAVTWTLCTIPDVEAALVEMRRVLKPDGRLLFIEHGLSDVESVARWQDRLNPIQNVIGCGCNLNRPIDALVRKAGFEITSLDRFVQERTPRFIGTLYRGVARP
jgi:ubiquinone/menaquinone biosynthesis C-methylase UbiE